MSQYLKIPNSETECLIEIDDLDKSYDESFLSKMRKKRNNYRNNLKGNAEKGAEKYLSIPIYNDTKMLYKDVDRIMESINKICHDRNIISYKISINNESWLDGFKELSNIYDKFQNTSLVKNDIFMNKYNSLHL